MHRKRIVVTGIGVVTPNGNDLATFWENVKVGRVAIGPIDFPDFPGWFSSPIGARVEGFDEPTVGSAPETIRSARFAVAAAAEALGHSRLVPADLPSHRVGVVVGTCQGAAAELPEGAVVERSPFDFMQLSCDVVARHFGLRGPRAVLSNACASGANGVGLARDLLWNDAADVMLAGGTDSLTFFSMSGFSSLQSIDSRPCSPYGRSSGLTLGEGAAFLVLEPLDLAEARGAPIVCELLGYGLSADAYHPTAPDPTGRGATLAMERALRQAGIDADDVDYVNGHGTGTQANDEMERRAFRAVFGARTPDVPVSSTKSMIGHSLGASGAIEAAVCALAVRDGFVPPTAGLDESHDKDFDFVPGVGRPAPVRVAMSNNYAFAGSNTSLVLGRLVDRPHPPPAPPADVFVTGIGIVGPLGIGIDEWEKGLAEGRNGVGPLSAFDAGGFRCRLAAELCDLPSRGWAASNAWRRMDGLSRRALVASRLAWKHAEMAPSIDELQDIALFLGTGSGPLATMVAFDDSARVGPGRANPGLFPNAAVNAAGGHVCTALGIRGATSTVTSGAVSGLVALEYAAVLLRQGGASTALVVAADELSPRLFEAADRVDGVLSATGLRPFDMDADGTVLGEGAVTLVLETAESVARRGGHPLARLVGGSLASDVDDDFPCSTDGYDRAMRGALEQASVDPAEVGYCAAAAAGMPAVDEAEAAALAGLFGGRTPVGAPKSLAGEALSTSGLVNVVACILAVRRGALTPTLGLRRPRFADDLRHVDAPVTAPAPRFALANASANGSVYASALVGAI